MLNIKGVLYTLNEPLIMGIVNVTPDSFYAGARYNDEVAIETRLQQMVEEEVDIVDVGACSTRPGAKELSVEEEWNRLKMFFEIQKRHYPNLIISVDTYRSQIAQRCVELFGAAIINDVSGGFYDKEMFQTIANLHVPYVLTHIYGSPHDMQINSQRRNIISDMILFFSERLNQLHQLGATDIIIDPGFGFGKTLEQNYLIMSQLDKFQILDSPILVGISRKSMIYNVLSTTPENCQNGTTILNTIALQKGAKILRVHDVQEAVEVRKILGMME